MSSTFFDRRRGLEIVLAILVLFAGSALQAAGAPAIVVHLYEAVWAASMIMLVRFRWRPHVPLRAPLVRIVVWTVLLVVVLRVMMMVPSPAGRGISLTSISNVWLFAMVALAIPAAIGHELFFRGLIYDLAWQKGGVTLAVAASGLLPVLMQFPFGTSLPGVAVAAASGLLLAGSRAVSGSLLPAMLAHCLFSLGLIAFILQVM